MGFIKAMKKVGKVVASPITYPINTINKTRKVAKIADKIEDVANSVKIEDSMSKSFLKSTTFWFNIVSLAIAITQVVPLEPEMAAMIIAIGNIILRFITGQPIHIVEKKEEK